jgi:sortase A
MLLRVGLVMMVLSLTAAVGVALAVVGFQSDTPETATVSSKEPQAAETPAKAKKEPDKGKKLEIDKKDESQREEPDEQKEPKAPPPLPVADWPRPTDEEVDSAGEPRYYEPQPGSDMILTVEALGLYDVPVVSSDSLEALDAGLMHVPETSFPWDQSEGRNVYIAGHYLGYPGTNSRLVFYNLYQLRDGDQVVLRDGVGRAYKYRVSESFAATPEDSWVMGQEVGRDMLTLQTCIPPGFEERLIVRADRV